MMYPKTPRKENPALLKLAQGKPCLLRVKCSGSSSETTVAAHSNSQIHGKGMGRKADDCYTVWACARCHTWLDSSYNATGEERQFAFNSALDRQIKEWRKMLTDGKWYPRHELEAAKWALEQLK
jgi:ribosomal protein S27E